MSKLQSDGMWAQAQARAPFCTPNSLDNWDLAALHVIIDLLPEKPLPPQEIPSPALAFLHPTRCPSIRNFAAEISPGT